ncbi:TonB-dependent receptor [Sphingobium sp. SJ10-10]|uniref:TonB-dependent receptor n=1 Tax=Sphingobium sp. SJ10-10 TaxID=3114999 RepID=UPI002E18E657|nr:TonB-dependent receptor [Sphingobium sp. SJ10-10]
MKGSIYLMGISLTALAIPMAQAQSRPDAADTEVSPDIVVTAQKRTERLQDVPIAVNVASSEQLENSGVKELPQLQAIIPGLNVAVSSGSFLPSIRGVATSSNIVENPVALYIDGVYLPQQQEGLRDLADVEQITVLKGPQGTLFGRNATAGVLQIKTLGPDFDTSGQFNLSYGSYQTVHSNAYITTGLSDRFAVSLSAAYQTQGKGWGKSLTTGKEESKLYHSYSLRGKLLFQIGDATSLLIQGDYLNRLDASANFRAYPGTTLAYQGFGPASNLYDSYSGLAGRALFKGGGVSATFKSDLGFADLISISAYRESDFDARYDLDAVAATIIDTNSSGQGRMYSQELQLISNAGGPLKWVAGAYYFNYRQGYDFFNRDFATGVAPGGAPYRFSPFNRNATLATFEKAESFAPFAQADLEVLPGTTITGGLRYTYEKRRLDGYRQLTDSMGVVAAPTHYTPAPLTAKKATWRLAVNRKLSTDAMIFASYSRGFKSGGFNIATPAAPRYLPEQLDDWEIGLKSQFWNRRITFNATGFYYKYKNVQVSQSIGNPPSQNVTNGAGAKIYGVDVDLTAKLVDGLTLSGGLELLHPYFTKYLNAPRGVDLSGGGVLIVPGGFDAKGQRIPFARTYVLNGALDYVTPAFGGNLEFNATVTRSGDYYFEPDNIVRQPAYTMLNGGVKLSDASDKYSLRFGVTNAFDKVIYSRDVTVAFGRMVSYGRPPREYTLTLGAKF